MKKHFGYIYKTTCLINGKIYIGQHTGNRADYIGSGCLLKKAINIPIVQKIAVKNMNFSIKKIIMILEYGYLKKKS